MIVNLLMNLVLSLFNFVFGWLELPTLPDTISSYLVQFKNYLSNGIGILAFYTDYSYLKTLAVIGVSCYVLVRNYSLILWVLKKIPFLNID